MVDEILAYLSNNEPISAFFELLAEDLKEYTDEEKLLAERVFQNGPIDFLIERRTIS